MILENSILEKEINKSQACIKKFGWFPDEGEDVPVLLWKVWEGMQKGQLSALASAKQKRKSYHF